MKYLGKITDDKDLVTKEYVDNAVAGGGGSAPPGTLYATDSEGNGDYAYGVPYADDQYGNFGELVTINALDTEGGDIVTTGNLKTIGGKSIVGSGNVPIGTVYEQSATTAISSTGIDDNTVGASITVPAGTYVVVAQWAFNTRSGSGTTNSAIRIVDGSNTVLAQTRVFAATYNWNALQCSAIAVLTAQTTLKVCGASSRAYTSGQANWIKAVRII